MLLRQSNHTHSGTAVLGILRPGYRCFPLRSPLGTRIELASVFCHVQIADEPHPFADMRELRELVERQQAIIAEQSRRLEELEALLKDKGERGSPSGGAPHAIPLYRPVSTSARASQPLAASTLGRPSAACP